MDKAKLANLKCKLKKLGISVDEYRDLLKKQNCRCINCNEEFARLPSVLIVKDIYCLTCVHCNHIGRWFSSSPEILEAVRRKLGKVVSIDQAKKEL